MGLFWVVYTYSLFVSCRRCHFLRLYLGKKSEIYFSALLEAKIMNMLIRQLNNPEVNLSVMKTV